MIRWHKAEDTYYDVYLDEVWTPTSGGMLTRVSALVRSLRDVGVEEDLIAMYTDLESRDEITDMAYSIRHSEILEDELSGDLV